MLNKIVKNVGKVICGGLVSLALLNSCNGVPKSFDKTNIWENKSGRMFVDISTDYKVIDFKTKGLPAEAQAEAQSPSITAPNGKFYGNDKINSYSPSTQLNFQEFNLSFGYELPRIPIFIGARTTLGAWDSLDIESNEKGRTVDFGFPRTDAGSYGKGYSHDQVIDNIDDYNRKSGQGQGGCEVVNLDDTPVRYFYGIKYEPWYIRPVIGFNFEIGDDKSRLFFQPSVTYERVTARYVKGIETEIDNHYRESLGHQDLDVFELMFKVGMTAVYERDKDKEVLSKNLSVSPYLYGGSVLTSQNGIDGWFAGVGTQFSF